MPAKKTHILIEQGASFSQDFLWLDGNNTPPTPIDLTGYSARMQIRRHHDSAEAILDVTNAGTEITLGTADGTITVSLDEAASAALPAPFYGVYDLEVEDESGYVTRLIEGHVEIRPEVTR